MQNKAKVKSAKINVSSFLTSKYVLIGHLVIQTTKPIQSQFKPIKANPKPICRKGQKLMQVLYLQAIMKKKRLWAKKKANLSQSKAN